MLSPFVQRVMDGESLDDAEARTAMEGIMAGEATPAQIAGFLVALRMKGETVAEITGFAQAMRGAALHVDLAADDLLDTCGTGGDGAGTFNVSTAAALVAAGGGARVAKHGNRSVSSSCGSADVLEGLGVTLTADRATLRRSLDEAGLAFLFAPFQHPAMKHAVGPRRELGVRTVFNVLGPLTNPAGARRQLLGVYDAALTAPLAEVLAMLGSEHALVVHGAGGMDEISTLGPTAVAEWRDGTLTTGTIDPGELGLAIAAVADLAGADPDTNAQIVRDVVAGVGGPREDIVALNAGAALYVAGVADSIADGLERARASIRQGAAADRLERLVTATAGGAP